ncbi:ribonuclease H-like domain-containing protein [Mycena polygramma]|nr:ribonuclease H-like domain-containing protein [Mycena polygramma]
MPFILEAWTDGACRRNGSHDAVAGAGVFFPRYPQGNQSVALPRNPRPTNQRAELTAIVLALSTAQEKQRSICAGNPQPPYFHVTVHSDSDYAVKCLNQWIFVWLQNGWVNAEGRPVVNQDLIQEADNLRLAIEGSFNGG